MRAVIVRRHGGPEVLELQEAADPEPAADEAIVKVICAGVNFIDIYYRTGAFSLQPPLIPGSEAAGHVVAVGASVDPAIVGTKVAFVTYPSLQGTYAEKVRVKAWRLVPVPESVSASVAGGSLMAGMTAHYLVHDIRPFREGETCLVHAAAGGVGSLLVQMLSEQGVRVIGSVSTPEKAKIPRENGAELVVVSTEDELVSRVREATDGRGVHAVFDSIGRTTFDDSLECLAKRGWLIQFGISSGVPRAISPEELLHRGSLVLTRPGLVDFSATDAELQARARAVFSMLEQGTIHLRIQDVMPLEAAAEAHNIMEGRRTTGKLLLTTE